MNDDKQFMTPLMCQEMHDKERKYSTNILLSTMGILVTICIVIAGYLTNSIANHAEQITINKTKIETSMYQINKIESRLDEIQTDIKGIERLLIKYTEPK